ncbi:MAG: Nif3-like dinuclear metal center hexameric protein [Candidatus Zipacnadales bacterium]
MKAIAVGTFIEGLTEGMGQEEGFRYGDPDIEVTGVLVCWMATVEAIETAAQKGCNLIVCHEELTFPYEFRDSNAIRYLWWRPNARRLSLLGKHGITVYRAHGMLDRYCILDDFAEMLGLPKPIVREGYVRIHVIEPTALRDLAHHVKERVGLSHVRVCGDLDRKVSRVGCPWGGLGLSLNTAFMQSLLPHNPEVFIAGETDDYGMRFAIDCDIPLIETSHATSENPGLAHFARDLKHAFPHLRIFYYENPVPWTTL